MSNIVEELCNNIEMNFLRLAESEPLTAAFLLSNLYLFSSIDHGNNENQRKERTLSFVKRSILAYQVNNIWKAINNISLATWQLMEQGTKNQLLTLKRQMICDSTYFKEIPAESLLVLGKKVEWHREVLIALIRKHLREQHLTDYFNDFSYDLLIIGGVEQNYLYVCGFIKQCSSLPLAYIKQLGEDPIIAQHLLLDLTGSAFYFDISSHFAERHESLRASIAQNWQRYFETYSLSAQQKALISAKLARLKEYSAFSEINIDSFVSRAIPRENPINKARTHSILGASFTSIGLLGVGASGGFSVIGGVASAAFLPAFVAASTLWFGYCVTKRIAEGISLRNRF